MKFRIGQAEAILTAVTALVVALSKVTAFSTVITLPNALSALPQFLGTASLIVAILLVFQFAEQINKWSAMARSATALVLLIVGIMAATQFRMDLTENSFQVRCEDEEDDPEVVVLPRQPSEELLRMARMPSGEVNYGVRWCETSGEISRQDEFPTKVDSEAAGTVRELTLLIILAESLLGLAIAFALVGTVLTNKEPAAP